MKLGHLFRGLSSLDGYDRTLSFNLTEPDGTSYAAKDCIAVGVIARNNSDGSVVGIDGGTASNWTWCENIAVGMIGARGDTRGNALKITADSRDIAASTIVQSSTRSSPVNAGVSVSSQNSGADAPMRVNISDVAVEDKKWGIRVEDGVRDATVSNISVVNPSDVGIDIRGSATDVRIDDFTVEGAGGQGIYARGSTQRVTFRNGVVKNGDIAGGVFGGSDILLDNIHFETNQLGDSSGAEVTEAGTDTDYRKVSFNATANKIAESSPTRPRWEGVIGGGPLSKQDLSTVTGQFQGDRAMSDGTNTTSFTIAVWTGANWQPSDGGATI